MREGVGSGFSGIQDLADGGKRFDALDVAVSRRRMYRGGV